MKAMPAEHGDSDPDMVEHTLQGGFRLLRFPPALEEAYVLARGADRTVKLILAGLIGAVLFCAIMVPDHVVAPQHMALSVGLRGGVFGGVVLLGLFVLHRLSMPRLNEWMVVPLTVLAAVIAAIQTQVDGREMAFARIVEITLVVAFATVFTRFWPMLVACLLMLAVHVQTLLVSPASADVLKPGITLMLVTTIAFGLYTTYTRERSDRQAWLLDLREQKLRASVDAGNRQLRTMARTDALTGTANRRAFDDALAQHLSESPSRHLALLLVDVDHFKAYNDHYGHQAGDRCLCRVADVLSACLRRPIDLLARWGGEEFAILLSEADEAVARQVADRICATVQAQNMAHAASSCATCVTVSIGVALSPADQPQQALALLHAADQALYRAKHDGRNRYTVSTDLREANAQPC
ncbi:MAG: hypothetical protein RI907_1086 [Pseudomonadota bacterium]